MNEKDLQKIIITIAVLIAGLFVLVTLKPDILPNQNVEPTKTEQVNETVISYQGVEGKTALELLKVSYDVKTQEYTGVGEFVTEIDGLAGNADHFWGFYVNGRMAEVGASQYVTKSSDTIEWRYEQIIR